MARLPSAFCAQRRPAMPKHLLFMLYALVAYLIFLATFLYAVCFVGGFLVPTQLDLPSRDSLAASVGIDVALLALFAVQHSVMARKWFKERWTQIIPWAIERSPYVLSATLALLLLFWQGRRSGLQIWSVGNAGLRISLWALFAAGWATVLV